MIFSLLDLRVPQGALSRGFPHSFGGLEVR